MLIGLLVGVLAAFGWMQWVTARDARDLVQLETRADSLSLVAQRPMARVQTELASVRDALRQSQAEVARLRSELAAASSNGDVGSRERPGSTIARSRARTRTRWRCSPSSTLTARSSAGPASPWTPRARSSPAGHVLVGEEGHREPRRIAVKVSSTKQWLRGRFVGVADSADVGAVKVDIGGGTPRVMGFARDPLGLERGDPVAIIGYPLGEDLPTQRPPGRAAWSQPRRSPRGTVSKVLPSLVQVDGYGAPGSSDSPIFDREGRVATVLYGGNRECQGKIIYAVPGPLVIDYLRTIGVR